jgi:hypothetical protein
MLAKSQLIMKEIHGGGGGGSAESIKDGRNYTNNS